MNKLRPISFAVAKHAPARSVISRRDISTIVPPKIASPVGLEQTKGVSRVNFIKQFYAKLPKGPAPEKPVTGPISWYQHRYFGKNPSFAPIWHLIFTLMFIGYSEQYYFHLRHHKKNAH